MLLMLSCTKVSDPHIRVGMNIWPGYEPLILAKDRGYIDRDAIRLVQYTSATQELEGFRNGNLEVVAITLDEFLQLRHDIPDVCIIAVLDESRGADVILGKPEISGLSRLTGKRIAFESTALGAYMLSRALESAGMSPADIQPVRVELDRHEEAYIEDAADAFVTYEPIATRLRALGAVSLFDSTRIPGEIFDVLVARHATIDEHGPTLTSLLGAWFRALDEIGRDPEESYRVLGAQMGLSNDEATAAYGKLVLASEAKNDELLRGTPAPIEVIAKRMMKTMVGHQLIAGPVSLEGMIDRRPLDSYLRTREP